MTGKQKRKGYKPGRDSYNEDRQPTRQELRSDDDRMREWEDTGKLPCPHGRPCYLWCPHCMGFS